MNVIKKTIAEVANEYNNNEVNPVLLWDSIKIAQIRKRKESQNEVKGNKLRM